MAEKDKKSGALRWRRVDFTIGMLKGKTLIQARSHEEAVEIFWKRLENLGSPLPERPRFRVISDAMIENIRAQFNENVERLGFEWAPRAPSVFRSLIRENVDGMDWPDVIDA